MPEIGTAHASPRDASGPPAVRPPFVEVYTDYFEFVWRSLRRLGVRESSLDDALQEVFLVVHRRLADFEGRSSMRTWLFGIILRVARSQRRTHQRKDAPLSSSPEDLDSLLSPGHSPDDAARVVEATRILHRLLDSLDDEKRAIFILAELEELPVSEIAEALGVNVNTVYSRLRAARKEFDLALARHRARTDRMEQP